MKHFQAVNFGMLFAFSYRVMAEKQNSKDAVRKLLEGRMDPESMLAREITEAVTERVLKNSAPSEPSR